MGKVKTNKNKSKVETISIDDESVISNKGISKFFKEDKPVWATYDATRKLPSFIDGLKNSQRKLVYTALSKLKKDEMMKTDNFCSLVSIETAYIHGVSSLYTVCDSLTQDFVGACSYPLFVGNDGGWGSRLVNMSSAPRYTRLGVAEITRILFKDIDTEVLDCKQYFEGQWIEPRWLCPIIPVVFLNLSSGITAGFREEIFPRSLKQIVDVLENTIKNNGVIDKTYFLKKFKIPNFRGFLGDIKCDAENPTKFYVNGCITKINESKNHITYKISEIPVSVSYSSYVSFLESLIETKTIIDYEDLSNAKTSELCFLVKASKDVDISDLYQTFNLGKTMSEYYNCIDKDGKVRQFDSVIDIFSEYFKIRLDLYKKRREYLLETKRNEIKVLASKYIFCSKIANSEIEIKGKNKNQLLTIIEKFDKIVKVDGTYDYLFWSNILSLTKDELSSLFQRIKTKKEELKSLEKKSAEDIWLEELQELKKFF